MTELMKQVVKTVLGIVAFVGLVSLGFHFGTLWGILAIIVCYAVNRYFDWRMNGQGIRKDGGS